MYNLSNSGEEKRGNSVGENLTSQGNKNVNMKEKKIGPPRPKLTPVAGPQMKPLNRRVPEKRPSNMNELGQMKMKGVHLQDTSSNEARENSMKGVKNMETCKQENLTTHENNSLNTKEKKIGQPRPKPTPVVGPQKKPMNRRILDRIPASMNKSEQTNMKECVIVQAVSSYEACENSAKAHPAPCNSDKSPLKPRPIAKQMMSSPPYDSSVEKAINTEALKNDEGAKTPAVR
ncbi:hypothetical protein SK128_003005, partial [Halocaridina rubra]